LRPYLSEPINVSCNLPTLGSYSIDFTILSNFSRNYFELLQNLISKYYVDSSVHHEKFNRHLVPSKNIITHPNLCLLHARDHGPSCLCYGNHSYSDYESSFMDLQHNRWNGENTDINLKC